jgi:hypothetical protein
VRGSARDEFFSLKLWICVADGETMRTNHYSYRKSCRSLVRLLVAGCLLVAAAPAMTESDDATEPTVKRPDASEIAKREMDLLRTQLAAQQEQIEQLRQRVEAQAKLLERILQTQENAPDPSPQRAAAPSTDLDLGGSGAPTIPASDLARQGSQETAGEEAKPSPLSVRIGTAHITPVGFLDFTTVIRDKNVGSSISTNFGAVPFNNTVNGNLREYRFSAQNSRLGLRVDAKVRGFDLLGYLETDFLGLVPGNVAVSSNSDTQRLRLFWVDMRKDKFEWLAGQSWSLLTPNRKGLSPLPGDIFFTQTIDTNYQVGLTWSRNPQFRLIYHATPSVTLGWSIEASEQYAGGSSGSGTITLPSELVPHYGPQLNTGGSAFGVPNPHQDNIVKIAFDPKLGNRAMHFEFAGLVSRFAFYNPLGNRHFNATGGGGAANFNIELVKNLRLFVNTYHSSGGGRWIFGQGPDLIIQGDGSPSLVHSSSTVDGFEYQATPMTLFYGYYGGAYFKKNSAIDPANGQTVGFGYTGSPSNHNRVLHEGTFGIAHTFWRDPNYGAMQLMTQYSYLVRHPWYVAPGQPGGAHLNMLYLNLRYSLPGAPPAGQK